MRIPLPLRAARVCAAATLIFSLSLAPSYARMGGSGASFARPALGGGHFSRLAPRGFNRGVDFNRFGFNRFGPNRFNRFGFNRFNRFGSNRFDGNQLLIGGGWGGWGWDGGGGVPASTGASEPIIVGDGAPVIINVGVGPGDGGGAYSEGCVIHKLNYDSNGKYVGERQIPQC
jgi:hypothetical protein